MLHYYCMNNLSFTVSVRYLRTFLTVTFFFVFVPCTWGQPVITSFSPASGPVGTTVTITGSNFSTTPANNIVYFGAVKANVTAATSTSLTVAVPVGTTHKPITVTVNGLTGYSTRPFLVTFSGGGQINSSSFGARQDFTTDIRPNAIVLSDFDGDGKIDVATANNHSNAGLASVSILRNTSSAANISFGAKQDIVTGGLTYCIASADIDGDGKHDIVSGSITSSNISVFRNTSTVGNISFAPKIDIAVTGAPFDIALGDIDGDGKTDISIVDNGVSFQGLSVFRNTGTIGTISFAPKVDFTSQLSPKSIVSADLDGDGKTDIGFTNENSNSFSIYRNTSTSGSVSFATRIDFPCGSGNQPYNLAIADIDNDAKTDMIVVINNTSGGGAQLFRNTGSVGNVSFAYNASIASGVSSNTCYRAAVNDINGDGKTDITLTVSGSSSGQSQVYQNNTSGSSFSFGSPISFLGSFAPYAIGFGDIEGDGKPDLVISEFTGEKISAYRNKAGSPAVSSFSPTTAASAATVTINGSNFSGTTSVTFGGVGATTFSIVNSTTITALVGTGASGDITVTNSFGSGSKSGFQFAGPPIVSSFTPTSGFSGTTVVISGFNFNNTSAVSFGATAATSFNVVDPFTINATVGLGTTGNVSVSTPFGSGSLAGFTYAPVPIINSFTPTAAGLGTTVTISGMNFTGTTAVSFGGVAASSFNVVSNTTLAAVVGNGVSGPISVTNAFGTSSINGFTFIPPPIITSFNPVSAGSGATVTINGSNFTGATAVKFGTFNASSFAVVNPNTISAVVIGGGSGSISVTTPGGTGSLPGFTFIPAPTISSFSPSIVGPGSIVTINGTSLNLTTSVKFGGVEATSFTVINDSRIDAVAGNGATGNVAVVTPGGNASANTITFTAAPVIHNISSVSGPVGTSVVISGANFGNSPSSSLVQFGAVKGVVTSSSVNMITVNAPLSATNKPISVTSLLSGLTGTSEFPFKITFPSDPNAINSNSFANQMVLSVGQKPIDLDIGDIDNDNKPDIVVANSNSDFFSVFRNISSPSQIALAIRNDINAGLGARDIVLRDMNADGKLDIIMSKYSSPPATNCNLLVFINRSSNSNINFDPPLIFSTFDNFEQLAVDDLNNDGKLDVVGICGNCSIVNGGYVTVFQNTSSASTLSFNQYRSYFSFSLLSNTLMRGIETRDIDNDGRKDILIGTWLNTQAFIVLRNTTTTTIVTLSPVLLTNNPIGQVSPDPIIDDFDNDGKFDIISAKIVRRSNGGFNFSQSLQSDIGMGGTSADLTGEGMPELITQFAIAVGNNRLSISKNTSSIGSINFSPTVHFSSANTILKIDAGDIDGDTKPDICTANLDSNTISIFRNRVAEVLPPSPIINSFTPLIGNNLDQITITGNNFQQTNSVSFGGVPASYFVVQSPTTIIAIPGSGASGTVSVTTPGGTSSMNGFTYLNVSLPTITSFSPSIASNGEIVTITGTNLTGTTSVSFGGVAATSFTVVSSTSITATVGTGSSGNVSLTTLGGTATLAGFIFIAPPTITSFTPATATNGATVTITGTNLTGATAVSFGGVAASSFTVVNATTITAVVGAGATGSISVTTPGGTATKSGFTYSTVTAVIDPSAVNSAELTVTPNPGDDIILIKHPSSAKGVTLQFYDVTGRVVKEVNIGRTVVQTEVNVSSLSPAIYYILWNDDKRKLTRVFMVK